MIHLILIASLLLCKVFGITDADWFIVLFVVCIIGLIPYKTANVDAVDFHLNRQKSEIGQLKEMLRELNSKIEELENKIDERT